jgi:lipopolysaccharide/colanic/teichoic acid biosynthesis glycosyltransferase
MMKKQARIRNKEEGVRLRDGSINTEISWIQKYDPERYLLKGQSYLRAKRVFDLTFTFISAIGWIPLMLLAMLLLKHEYPSRKVFYKQLRTGKGGKRFWMYKFQTMVPNAEELKPALMHLNILEWPDFKIVDDPRVTKIGKILRKTSIDELPQMINIIKGEMSWVGPRPTSFAPDTYKIWQTERLEVTPGLTGLWQITRRGESEFKDRLLLDIAYIKHRCMLLDIDIMFRTVFSILQGRGVT